MDTQKRITKQNILSWLIGAIAFIFALVPTVVFAQQSTNLQVQVYYDNCSGDLHSAVDAVSRIAVQNAAGLEVAAVDYPSWGPANGVQNFGLETGTYTVTATMKRFNEWAPQQQGDLAPDPAAPVYGRVVVNVQADAIAVVRGIARSLNCPPVQPSATFEVGPTDIEVNDTVFYTVTITNNWTVPITATFNFPYSPLLHPVADPDTGIISRTFELDPDNVIKFSVPFVAVEDGYAAAQANVKFTSSEESAEVPLWADAINIRLFQGRLVIGVVHSDCSGENEQPISDGLLSVYSPAGLNESWPGGGPASSQRAWEVPPGTYIVTATVNLYYEWAPAGEFTPVDNSNWSGQATAQIFMAPDSLSMLHATVRDASCHLQQAVITPTVSDTDVWPGDIVTYTIVASNPNSSTVHAQMIWKYPGNLMVLQDGGTSGQWSAPTNTELMAIGREVQMTPHETLTDTFIYTASMPGFLNELLNPLMDITLLDPTVLYESFGTPPYVVVHKLDAVPAPMLTLPVTVTENSPIFATVVISTGTTFPDVPVVLQIATTDNMLFDPCIGDGLLFMPEASCGHGAQASAVNGVLTWSGRVGPEGKTFQLGWHPTDIGQASFDVTVTVPDAANSAEGTVQVEREIIDDPLLGSIFLPLIAR